MPNWCENDLVCQGKKVDLERLLKFVKGETDFDFNRIIPYPIHLKKLDDRFQVLFDQAQKGLIPFENVPESGYSTEGFNWCIKHWGTKWNANEVYIGKIKDYMGGSKVTIHFNTAWSPPREVILELSSYFPHILFTLSYYERGQSYYGKSKLINRRYIREIEGDYFGPRGG